RAASGGAEQRIGQSGWQRGDRDVAVVGVSGRRTTDILQSQRLVERDRPIDADRRGYPASLERLQPGAEAGGRACSFRSSPPRAKRVEEAGEPALTNGHDCALPLLMTMSNHI